MVRASTWVMKAANARCHVVRMTAIDKGVRITISPAENQKTYGML